MLDRYCLSMTANSLITPVGEVLLSVSGKVYRGGDVACYIFCYLEAHGDGRFINHRADCGYAECFVY
jgi:hypothetical protein